MLKGRGREQPTVQLPAELCRWLQQHAPYFFPQCGDGSAVSDTHRTHMVFPVNGQCPADHPNVYPRINYAVHYRAQKGAGAQLSSGDAYTSAYADYFEAWDSQNLQHLIDKCIKSGITCGKTP
jgi:hypothetical protein